MENAQEVASAEVTAKEIAELQEELLSALPLEKHGKVKAITTLALTEFHRRAQLQEDLSTVFKLGTKSVDASKGLPLNVGQMKRLKKLGTSMDNFKSGMDDTHLYNFAEVILTRADTSLKPEEVELLEIRDIGRIARVMMNAQLKEDEPDRPTSASSTS